MPTSPNPIKPSVLEQPRSKSMVVSPTLTPSSQNLDRTAISVGAQVERGAAGNNDWGCALEQSIAVYTSDPTEFAQQQQRSAEAIAEQEAADRALALQLQNEPPSRIVDPPPRPFQEPENTTTTGKALQFTQLLMQTFQENPYAKEELMNLINGDIVLACAEKLFERQKKLSHGPHDVDIAFASTDDNGQIVKAPSPATFGDGVYTSNNPFSPIFQEFPTEVILVARLKGQVELANATTPRNDQHHQSHNIDSSILQSRTDDEICVLKRSSQCVPLLTIDVGELDFDHDDAPGNDFVHRMHCLLQGVVDKTWNIGRPPTIVTRVLPSETRASFQNEAPPDDEQAATMEEPWLGIEPPDVPAIPRTRTWTLHSLIRYIAPDSIARDKFCIPTEERLRNLLPVSDQPGRCLICNKKGSDTLFPDCRHPFHVSCLFRRLNRGDNRKCPKCSSESNRLLLRETANISPTSKEPALVLMARLDLTHHDSRLISQSSSSKGHHCTASESVVTLVAATKANGAVDLKRLFLVYTCGSTFDIKLSHDPGPDERIATWSGMFHDVTFVQYLHERARDHVQRCPGCRGPFRRRGPSSVIIGTMPSGTMRVDAVPEVTCSGHAPGTLLVTYRLEGGIQKDYHDSPGTPFGPIYREAFLPNDRQGRDLLKRLTFAFYRGLTFVVHSTIRDDGEHMGSIRWGAILHKSSLSPGTNGYPDPSYFVAANATLDSLGVPQADTL